MKTPSQSKYAQVFIFRKEVLIPYFSLFLISIFSMYFIIISFFKCKISGICETKFNWIKLTLFYCCNG